ncbi:MAG: PQQ-binding-like beta-propeller repeat protein [Candidatus ainarchaeum sp.]|nr:PQQ-binding-like beta-propeller repeat protein [Candidatus ainarchaeum sp.]MDD5096689.1 PQQ-binding-like beta-propeller repeat protein [Candidatus ainarchaeum sp.]
MRGTLPLLLLLSILSLSFAGELWSYRVDGAATARPAVIGDNAVVGTENGAVYALSQGQVRWTQRFNGSVSAVAAMGDRAVVAAGNRVYAIGPTGSILWNSDARGVRGISASDKVYVSYDAGIKALDDRGQLSWFYNVTLPTEPSSEAAGYVVFGSGNKIVALRSDGQKFWEQEVGPSWDVAPLVWSGTVFAGTSEGKLYSINLYTGQVLWEYRAGDMITTTPAHAGAYIIFGTAGGNVYAVNNGELIWGAKVDGMANGKILIDGNVAYLSTRKSLYAINVADGGIIMRRQFVDWPSPPALSGGAVVLGTAEGRVYAIDSSRGCGFVFPEPDSVVGDADVAVRGSSFSKYGGVKTYLRLNGGEWSEVGGEEWGYALNPSAFPFGVITMECYVSDSSGLEAAPFSSITLIKGEVAKQLMRVQYPSTAKEGEPFTIIVVGMDGHPLDDVSATMGGQAFEGSGEITITPGVSGRQEVAVSKRGYEDAEFAVEVKPQPTLAYVAAAVFLLAAAGYAYFGYIKIKK